MEKNLLKMDLRVFPHFFSPNQGRKVPSLRQIVDSYLASDLDVVALTSCHTATSGMDRRFHDYMKELDTLRPHNYSYDDSGGILTVEGKSNRKIIIVHTQKVRAYDGDSPAYLNIIGTNTLITPTRDIRETAREAIDLGAIVNVCDPTTKSGASLDTALGLISDVAHGVELGAANSKGDHLNLILSSGIFPIAVSGAHRYTSAGTSYTVFESEKDFSIEELKSEIIFGNFSPVHGNISFWRTFWDRDIHILKSGLGHILAGGKRKEEYLKVVKGKKKD